MTRPIHLLVVLLAVLLAVALLATPARAEQQPSDVAILEGDGMRLEIHSIDEQEGKLAGVIVALQRAFMFVLVAQDNSGNYEGRFAELGTEKAIDCTARIAQDGSIAFKTGSKTYNLKFTGRGPSILGGSEAGGGQQANNGGGQQPQNGQNGQSGQGQQAAPEKPKVENPSVADGLAALEIGDNQTAYDNFHPLAGNDDADACFHLGRMFHFGYGLEPDGKEATTYYEKAAKQRHAQAIVHLGMLHRDGVGGLPVDAAAAATRFEEAAKLGDDTGQFCLGEVKWETGTQDATALAWWMLAADAGNKRAEYNVRTLRRTLKADVVAAAEKQAEALRTDVAAAVRATPPIGLADTSGRGTNTAALVGRSTLSQRMPFPVMSDPDAVKRIEAAVPRVARP